MDTHLLDDIEYRYVQASANVRFCNWIIDRALLYGVWRLALNYFSYPISLFIYSIAGTEKWSLYLVTYLLSALFHLFYFTLFEASTGGKTLGKFITRTRAVTVDGARMNFQAVLLRTLCRFVPFDAFSAFGKPSYPWHDRLSKTLVVDEKQTQLPPWN